MKAICCGWSQAWFQLLFTMRSDIIRRIITTQLNNCVIYQLSAVMYMNNLSHHEIYVRGKISLLILKIR